MKKWDHHELEKKWANSAALVYGRPCDVAVDEVDSLYNDWFEDDVLEFHPAVWPLGEQEPGRQDIRCLYGAGDFTFCHDNGQNRHREFEPLALKELTKEQACLDAFELDLEPPIGRYGSEDDAWYVVTGGQPVSLYYGIMVKPSQVNDNPVEGLEVVRGELAGGKAHPRVIIGRCLGDTGDNRLMPFSLKDKRIKEIVALLKKAYPKQRAHGFVLIPTDPKKAHVISPASSTSAKPAKHAQPDASFDVGLEHDMATWRARLESFFADLEQDGAGLCSPSLSGEIYQLREASDILESWFDTPSFGHTDRSAEAAHWVGDHTQLVTLSIDLIDGGVVECVLGQITCSDGGYLAVSSDPADAERFKSLLGLTTATLSKREQVTLGHG